MKKLIVMLVLVTFMPSQAYCEKSTCFLSVAAVDDSIGNKDFAAIVGLDLARELKYMNFLRVEDESSAEYEIRITRCGTLNPKSPKSSKISNSNPDPYNITSIPIIGLIFGAYVV